MPCFDEHWLHAPVPVGIWNMDAQTKGCTDTRGEGGGSHALLCSDDLGHWTALTVDTVHCGRCPVSTVSAVQCTAVATVNRPTQCRRSPASVERAALMKQKMPDCQMAELPADSIGQNLLESPWLEWTREWKHAPWLQSDKVQNNPNRNLR